MNLKIQVNNQFLDTYAGESVQLSWTAFRFQTSLRAGYTNDLKIPKTTHNLSVLGAVGLLDSVTQMFGSKTVRAILQLEIRMMPVYIQVASIDRTDIQICLYEDSFPEYFKDKSSREYFKDTSATIYPWNFMTEQVYPSVFKSYYYGMAYSQLHAQFHGSLNVNSLISQMNTVSQFDMPLVDNDLYTVCTNKKVCPENTIQMFEGKCNLNSHGDMLLMGGQHVTNNLSIKYSIESEEDAYDGIEFNRDCTVQLKIWVAWQAKNSSSQTGFIIRHLDSGGNSLQTFYPNIRGDQYKNKIDTFTYSFNISAGDKLTFRLNVADQYYKHCNMLGKLTITNYEIYDTDYDTELEYIWRPPYLNYYDHSSDTWKKGFWTGQSFTYSYKARNETNVRTATVSTTYEGLSYFGLYANLPEFKLCDFWYSLQWIIGKKLSYDHKNTTVFIDPNDSAVITGEITAMRPKSDKLGQKNYLAFKSDDNPQLVSTIPNEWLQSSYKLHESKFAKVENVVGSQLGCVNQYSNPEFDEDSFEFSCDYEEVKAFTIWRAYGNRLSPVYFPTLSLNKLKQSVEVDITTFTPLLRDKDIVTLDGHKYFIVSCKTNVATQKSELTCLLIPASRPIHTLPFSPSRP